MHIFSCIETRLIPHLSPPAGEHEVRVHILLPKLLRHIETQGAVLVINVPLSDVRQHRMGIVELFKFVSCIRVLGVLVRMIFQSELPKKKIDKDILKMKNFLETCTAKKLHWPKDYIDILGMKLDISKVKNRRVIPPRTYVISGNIFKWL